MNHCGESTYYQQCVCSAGCQKCSGRGFIPTGNIPLPEMQLGLSYKVRIYGNEIVYCVLRKLEDGFSCQYIYTDGFGFVSERSVSHVIRIPWTLIDQLRQINNPSKGMTSLIKYLNDTKTFSLSNLSIDIGLSVYEVIWNGALRDYDLNHGTQLHKKVICNPGPIFNREIVLIKN